MAQTVDVPASLEINSIKASPKKLPTVIGLDSRVENETTIINIRFDQKATTSTLDIEAHGTFIQIPLKDTLISKSGEFIDSKSPYVNKLVGFQHSDNRSSIRLFVNQEASIIKSAVELSETTEGYALIIDHKKVALALKSDPKITAAPPSSESAEEVIAKTKIVKNNPKPAEITKATKTKEQAPAPLAFATNKNLDSKLGVAAIFCAIMFFGMIVIYLAKPTLRRLRQSSDASDFESVTMRTLATKQINQKQRIELMEIGGEKILLSIGPDQVNYLTTLARSAPITNHNTETARAPIRVQPSQAQAAIAAPKTEKAAVARANTQASKAQPSQTKRVNVAINDEIKMEYKRSSERKPNEAISDVTRMIREKLKNLPGV
jgi:flagellar biogenesis protein FliO